MHPYRPKAPPSPERKLFEMFAPGVAYISVTDNNSDQRLWPSSITLLVGYYETDLILETSVTLDGNFSPVPASTRYDWS
jgi:hypothetical protein